MFSTSKAHNAYITGETGFSVALNVAISALFAWLVFPKTGQIELYGMSGMAFDLVPTTFMITFATSLALGLITGQRVRKGKIDRQPAAQWKAGLHLLIGRTLPSNPFVRAILWALSVSVVLVPLMIAGLELLDVRALSFTPFLIFKLIYGAVLALLITPPLLTSALLERGSGMIRA
ncbi:MAG: hypothetical protein RKE49_11940 [Oceanicaulis sp.]